MNDKTFLKRLEELEKQIDNILLIVKGEIPKTSPDTSPNDKKTSPYTSPEHTWFSSN